MPKNLVFFALHFRWRSGGQDFWHFVKQEKNQETVDLYIFHPSMEDFKIEETEEFEIKDF